MPHGNSASFNYANLHIKRLQCKLASTVNFQIRLVGINIFFQFSWAKNNHFLTFNVIKNFKMRVVLEIRVLLEGESY